MPPQPIDPLAGPKLALAGRVVAMDAAHTVRDDGVVYVEAGKITAVRGAGEARPPGFDDAPLVATGGTIYPGLIELHNHLAYNILRLWAVPRKFGNRGQWTDTDDYRRLITGPMKVIGKSPELIPALVRYVECKCLLGGVTTTQGIYLSSNKSVPRYYKGIVRNVEQTNDPELPEAGSRVGDVAASSIDDFRRCLASRTCYLLHLAEGQDDSARNHFKALEYAPGEWAITPSLAGIHSAALKPEDFAVLAAKGASIVWSPLSNLLLYGGTADIAAAKAAGVRIGLGSDWSPSGSKNLLGELKAAHLVSQAGGGIFTDRELVAMVTSGAAAILGWQAALGSIEAGKRADLIAAAGVAGDPYATLIRARETAIRLVMINGIARYGVPKLMTALGADGERIRIGGSPRTLFLDQTTQDPAVAAVSLAAARKALSAALKSLPKRAKAQAAPASPPGDLHATTLGTGGPGTLAATAGAAAPDAPAGLSPSPRDAAGAPFSLSPSPREAAGPSSGLSPSPREARGRVGEGGPLGASSPDTPETWTLALDEILDVGTDMRPRLPLAGTAAATGPERLTAAAAAVAPDDLPKLTLDPLTVADDKSFFTEITKEANLPQYVKDGLKGMYG